MTTRVKIAIVEQAHNKVRVDTMTKGVKGEPDTCVQSITLEKEGDAAEQYVYGGQYIVVTETEAPAVPEA